MRILFVGESWLGSCARSLKEALARNPDVMLEEVNEDLFIPKPRSRWLRGVGRLLVGAYRNELRKQIFSKVECFKPDVVMVYKGFAIDPEVVESLRGGGRILVNVYPDCSPHAYGSRHRKAVGKYDLVISTKTFQPKLWQHTYGYKNACVFVPQGYDPALHLSPLPQSNFKFDVTMVATWRPEYDSLLREVSRILTGRGISFGVGGSGWLERRDGFPQDWFFAGEVQGMSYVEWLRQGRICIAPVTREVLLNGVRHPGDEDTTRTYELAAANCFFIHRRTPFVQRLYEEEKEVPMFDDAEELADLILRYLPDDEGRKKMAFLAHQRAVPAYSLDARANQILGFLSNYTKFRKDGSK